MKYFFASDIHGSAYWCRRTLEAFQKSGAEKLILLGDLLYHGPRNDLPEEYDTKAVTVMLNGVKEKVIAVRGNCDAEVDQMVLSFPILADFAWLRLNDINFFVTHGHVYNDVEEGRMPKITDGDVLIHGHIHLPVAEKKNFSDREGSYCLLNPGSVSLPKGGNSNSYGILDGREFSVYDFDGNRFKGIRL